MNHTMNTVVKVKQGKLSGICQDGCIVFKGVPYAKPPVGNLRFCAPQECEPWEGIRMADHFGNSAWQQRLEKGSFYDKEFYWNTDYETELSEDCLYLNIWMPETVNAEKGLPVAVWIHGGGFEHGYSHEMEFDGAAYAKRDVIYVSINYRVGVWGFLAHPWLSAKDPEGLSGNYGMLDQITALKWVKENIAAFGGDPDRLTIFGQSAGAMSVQTLISSPLSRNLISGAIMQSGGGYQAPLIRDVTLKEQEQVGVDFTDFCGIHTLEELQNADSAFLLEKQNAFIAQFEAHKLAFIPIIDGKVLESGYDEVIRSGNLPDIPYMLGCTCNDLLSDLQQVKAGIQGPIFDGCIRFGQEMSRQGRDNVYVYKFNRQLPGDDAGAWHSSELWYMFGTWKRCWRPFTEEDKALSEEMLDAWAGFMKQGCPGEDWKAYSEEIPFVKNFDVK